MSKYLTLDEKLCESCKNIAEFDESGIQLVLDSAINVLDGSITTETIESLVEHSNNTVASVQDMELIVKSASGMIWEFVKGNSLPSMAAVLTQVGFTESLANAFGKCVLENKFRLKNLKNTMAITSKRYLDMEWRLDMEIGSRNMTNSDIKPKYMLRLDFTNADHTNMSSAVTKPSSLASVACTDIESVHMEMDYANLINLQRELQTALDQMNGQHCNSCLHRKGMNAVSKRILSDLQTCYRSKPIKLIKI